MTVLEDSFNLIVRVNHVGSVCLFTELVLVLCG